ncbi:hypothetical protein VKT23_018721 [Stygiomarasmius scandens]|uniref:Uncharacterized protein n=1 Tax=Marasmiellus scandens TaxID=2682957 RepID=A0ABR1IQ44_9AGAR
MDVPATLPEETFVDKEGVPERYLEYAVGLTRISSSVKRFMACISTEFASEDMLLREYEVGNELLPEHLVSGLRMGVTTVDSIEVAQNRNRSNLPEPIANLAAESLRSAKSILGILADLGRWEFLEGLVWLNFHYAHHAVLIFGVWEVGRLNAATAVSANGYGHGQPEGQGQERHRGCSRRKDT